MNRNQPLGLPTGSVRAISFLMIVKELVPVLAALYGLCGGVIPAYFQSRKENQ